MATMYPVSLVLQNKKALVIGGGHVATRKAKGLLECEACVHVVAPEITDELRMLVDTKCCTWQQKEYESTDIDAAEIVFASTNDETVNARIFEDATKAKLLVNVADRPELCSFFLPSVLRRGRLSISVSTEGTSPLMARRIREGLEEQFCDCFSLYLDVLQSWRPRVNEALPEAHRMKFWEQAIDGRVLALVEADNVLEADALLSSIFESVK